MRHVILTFGLLVAAVFVCRAQDSFEPKTSWPYVYRDFTAGTVTRPNGQEVEGLYNINVSTGRVHFIDGDYIHEAKPSDVNVVTIGSDLFANVGGRMMQVVAGKGKNFIAHDTEINYVDLNATGAAYGSSSASVSTRKTTSIDGMDGPVNMNHMELKNGKDDGKVLPVLEKLYIVVMPNYSYAGKKDLMEMTGIDKDAMKAFLKDTKIKWSDPKSLMQIVEFLAKE